MSLQSNLNQLIARHRSQIEEEQIAISTILRSSEINLNNILVAPPDFALQTIEERTIRQSIDRLLKWYSLVEIAIVTGFIDFTLPDELSAEVVDLLSHAAVVQYYQTFNPKVLVNGIYNRALGRPKYEKQSNKVQRLFMDFLYLNEEIENNNEVSTFEKMLELNSDSTIDSLRQILNDPETLADVLAQPSTELFKCVRGSFEFLEFTEGFVDLMSKVERHPDLQFMFWHYHSEWYGNKWEVVRKILAITLEAGVGNIAKLYRPPIFNKYDSLEERETMDLIKDTIYEYDKHRDRLVSNIQYLHRLRKVYIPETALLVLA